MIIQVKLIYSISVKALEKQTKTLKIEEQKKIHALKVLKPGMEHLTVKDAILQYQLKEEANEIIKNNKI